MAREWAYSRRRNRGQLQRKRTANTLSRHSSTISSTTQASPINRTEEQGNAKATLALLASWGIVPISWPPFSPDLSPIKDIWDRLKDILQEIDPAVHRNSRRLREAVLRAWETITDTEIRERIRTMHQRCLDVIVANRIETKW
jgi:transposase